MLSSGIAPHNDTSTFSSVCSLANASIGILSSNVKAFSPNEVFVKGTKKELIMTSANSQVMPLVLNLLRSIKSLDISADDRQLRLLLVVFNPEALGLCEELRLPCFYPKHLFHQLGILHNMDRNYMVYGNEHFKRITLSLTHIIGWFLREEWTVFNTDVDIVWLKSPYDSSHISSSIFSYTKDIAVGGNNRPYYKSDHDINTGYYRVRPSEWSARFFERMYHECKDSHVDDQDCMKKLLSEGGETAMSHLAFLNTTDYPISGCVWKKMKDFQRERAHLFHAACMNGMAEKLGFMNDFQHLYCPRLQKVWVSVEGKGLFTNEDGKAALNTTLNEIRDQVKKKEKSSKVGLDDVLELC